MLGSSSIFESIIGTNFHMKRRISLILSFFFKILYLDQFLDYHQNENRHFSCRLIFTQMRFSSKILWKVDWSINIKSHEIIHACLLFQWFLIQIVLKLRPLTLQSLNLKFNYTMQTWRVGISWLMLSMTF